jgi:glycerophosphoryl diester phosphodiesterase
MIILAHRGACWYAPENTMAAFDKAVEVGASDMEFDVHLSKDGVPVVIHDDTVDTTTDGSGLVAQMTLAQLEALDAGTWYSPRFAGQRIPTLAEVLERYAGKIGMFVEVKANRPELAHEVVGLLKKYRQESRSAVISFHRPVVEVVRKVDSTLRVGYLTTGVQPRLVDEAARLGCHLVGIHLSMEHPETPVLVRRAHERGLKVLGWGMVMARDLRLALKVGFDYLSSDLPDQVAPMMETWKKEGRAHERV